MIYLNDQPKPGFLKFYIDKISILKGSFKKKI